MPEKFADVAVVCLFFNSYDKRYMETSKFLELCEDVPLLGHLTFGRPEFKPETLKLDEEGHLSVSCMLHLDITIHEFDMFISVKRQNSVDHLSEYARIKVNDMAQKLGDDDVLKKLDDWYKREKYRMEEKRNLALQNESEDVDGVFQWATIGPFTPYVMVDFTKYEAAGWSYVSSFDLRKTAVLYVLRKRKVP